MKKLLRTIAALVTATVAMTVFTLVATPNEAEAQTPAPYAADRFEFGTTCNADEIDRGIMIGVGLRVCSPIPPATGAYVPIMDATNCTNAGNALGLLFVQFATGNTGQSICTNGGRYVGQISGGVPFDITYCTQLGLTTYLVTIPIVAAFGQQDWCTLNVYMYDANAVTSNRIRRLIPVCITSDTVQNHPDVAKLTVGSQFLQGPNSYYTVIDGPQCKYNCIDGWDINCDGKLGDFCPIELDRQAARNVSSCLDASTAYGEVQQAVAVPAAAPAAAAPSSLAHTGAETPVFAYFGFGLLAFGAASLGHLRRRKD